VWNCKPAIGFGYCLYQYCVLAFVQNVSAMKNKKLLTGLGVLCFAAAAAMYFIGSSNGHLTELKDFWWVPLPLGALLLAIGMRKPA